MTAVIPITDTPEETMEQQPEAPKEIMPIWIGKRGRWVPAELHQGPYIGTDGKEHYDNGSVYNLHSDECFRVFGECYPFGSLLGGEVGYYLKNGATIRLRKAKCTTS